ncbi:MAG: tyrosine-type recombinase/integrase [Planctomyces sp.]|nr:tyrosine-type recombinase/integrase [Planctomyces sp.]
MARSKNNSSQKDSGNHHNTSRKRNAEPARSAPDTERGLTHSPYFNGLLYKRMSEDLHLKNNRKFASGSLRVAYSGIKFFYTRTCKRNWQTLAQMRIKDVKSLPEVLTIEQVHQIIDHCTTLRMAVYFWTVYSLGLRMNEGLNLQIGDIDGQRMMVHIHRGKGAKDRYIPLPNSTLLALRRYWATHRHPKFLFPADGRDHRGISHAQGPSAAKTPMSETAVQAGHAGSCPGVSGLRIDPAHETTSILHHHEF